MYTINDADNSVMLAMKLNNAPGNSPENNIGNVTLMNVLKGLAQRDWEASSTEVEILCNTPVVDLIVYGNLRITHTAITIAAVPFK